MRIHERMQRRRQCPGVPRLPIKSRTFLKSNSIDLTLRSPIKLSGFAALNRTYHLPAPSRPFPSSPIHRFTDFQSAIRTPQFVHPVGAFFSNGASVPFAFELPFTPHDLRFPDTKPQMTE